MLTKFPAPTENDDTGHPTRLCAHCAHHTGETKQGTPWCGRCEVWLVLDILTGEWVGVATLERRRNDRNLRACSARRRAAVEASVAAVIEATPLEWSITIATSGECIQLQLGAETEGTAAVAYIEPDHRHADSWHVRIRDHATGVSAPIYTAGGAHAARYDTAVAATEAAMNRIRTRQ